jgi:general secretion pathway protein F
VAAPTLNEFIALNDELAALLQAGVPVDIGLKSTGRNATAELERINLLVARRVSQGGVLTDILQDDDLELSAAYRSVMQLALQSGDLAAAIEARCRLAAEIGQSRHAVGFGMLYPLLLCCLAYLGLVALCLFLAPVLESFYETQRITPESGLLVIQRLQQSVPYWIGVPPVLLGGIFAWNWRASRVDSQSDIQSTRFFRYLPGVSQLLYWQRCANFADALVLLLESETTLTAALPIAAGAAGDAALSAAAEELALREQGISMQRGGSIQRLPPFLRWVLGQPTEGLNRIALLRIASGLYREAARRRAERIRIVAPLAASVVLGGGVTLLYGLALFVPIIQMYRQLAL